MADLYVTLSSLSLIITNPKLTLFSLYSLPSSSYSSACLDIGIIPTLIRLRSLLSFRNNCYKMRLLEVKTNEFMIWAERCCFQKIYNLSLISQFSSANDIEALVSCRNMAHIMCNIVILSSHFEVFIPKGKYPCLTRDWIKSLKTPIFECYFAFLLMIFDSEFFHSGSKVLQFWILIIT